MLIAYLVGMSPYLFLAFLLAIKFSGIEDL